MQFEELKCDVRDCRNIAAYTAKLDDIITLGVATRAIIKLCPIHMQQEQKIHETKGHKDKIKFTKIPFVDPEKLELICQRCGTHWTPRWYDERGNAGVIPKYCTKCKSRAWQYSH